MTDWTGTWSYGYDENNRLTNATPPNPVPEQPCGGDYGYDWVSNRLNPPTGTNHMVYNAADQLTSWPGMYSYSYYNDGSLMEVRNAQDAFVSSYTYNPMGLLDQAVYAGKTAVNTWDASDNRVGLTINGKVCSFVYDPTAEIPAVIEEMVNGIPAYYYREPDGALVARTDVVNSMRYYHFDALRSTRLLTDENGNVTDNYAYDVWGTIIAHDRYNGSIDQPYQYVGQLGYYTHYQDPDFKLLQLGVRFYGMEIGRFTQIDPIARYSESPYVYSADMPLSFVDPLGLRCRKAIYTQYGPEHIKSTTLVGTGYLRAEEESTTVIGSSEYSVIKCYFDWTEDQVIEYEVYDRVDTLCTICGVELLVWTKKTNIRKRTYTKHDIQRYKTIETSVVNAMYGDNMEKACIMAGRYKDVIPPAGKWRP
ncbi:MAG: RHS repeat-associated core domain-containing protein [Armatimonadota bacterium]